MATKVVTTRCTNCPTIFETEPIPKDQEHEVDRILQEKRHIAGETYKGMKCPNCTYGTLTVTSYMIPGEIKRGSEIKKGEVGTIQTIQVDEEAQTQASTMDPKGGEVSESITIGKGAFGIPDTERAEMEEEIDRTRKAMAWLTEKGKADSVLFRAADSYLITLTNHLEELS